MNRYMYRLNLAFLLHLAICHAAGVAARMVVMTLPTKKASLAGTGNRLLFIVVDRSAGAPR